MNEDHLIIAGGDEFRKKAERRRQLAKLPIEEKLQRLVQLQKIAYNIGKQAGRPVRKP